MATAQDRDRRKKIRKAHKEIVEINVEKVAKTIGHLTMAFQRRVLAEARRRISAVEAKAEQIEIDRQFGVRRPGRIAGERTPKRR